MLSFSEGEYGSSGKWNNVFESCSFSCVFLFLLASEILLRIVPFIMIYKRCPLVVVSSNNTNISNIYPGKLQWNGTLPVTLVAYLILIISWFDFKPELYGLRVSGRRIGHKHAVL